MPVRRSEGWTFYSSRQPSNDPNAWRLEIQGENFNALEFWITPSLDHEQEQIELTVWHPLFSKLPEDDRWKVIFLVLDEALGEFGTQSWISKITTSQDKLADALPLSELPAFVEKVELETGWKKYPPTNTWTTYQLAEPHDRFRRGDIIAGTSCNLKLLDDFLQSEDRLDDPLAKTGADYVFVRFPSEILPPEHQVEARGRIEDALQEALSSAGSGRHLGGALGTRFGYIDLIIFDAFESLEITKQVLLRESLPRGASIEFFADSKRGRRIII